MKTVVVQGDGVASVALPELGGKTILQVAKTPHLDRLASQGEFGLLTLPTDQYSLSGVVAHFALLGYDPSKYYSGLAPFEAASLGVLLDKHDMSFLCEFVTLATNNGRGDDKKLGPHLILNDAEAGGLESDEARELIDTLNDQLASETIQFYTGETHRHLMVWIGNPTRCGCQSPHAAQGQSIESFLPTGKGAEIIRELMEASRIILRGHPVNKEREEAGLKPANCIWLWGAGKAVELPNWTDRWHRAGVTISTASVHGGIAICAGLEVLNPQECDEFNESDFSVYVKLCRKALQTKDYVYLHVPMPCKDWTAEKHDVVEAVEAFDEQVIGPLVENFPKGEESQMLVLCTHAGGDAQLSTIPRPPFAFLGKGATQNTISPTSFHEIEAAQGPARDATRFASRLLAP